MNDMCRLPLAALLSLLSISVAQADTTIPITGIGTNVSAPVIIKTHVDSVTYSEPADVVINGLAAVEIRGTVSGVGWGGTGIVDRAANEHYQYSIPFVARWRKHGHCPRLVFYNHGGGRCLMDAVRREKAAGAANENRFAELNGDSLAGMPALIDQAAYISINRRGLQRDGTFSATYLSSVAPLTGSEIDCIQGELTPPGTASFQHPGLVPGAPVPVLPTNDAATCRDIARALEQIVANILGRPFRTRIAVGTSSGARLCAALNFGRSVIGNQSVRTGGNQIIPYDKGSPRIFDAYLLMGFPYTPGVEHADMEIPLSAPTIFLQGQGDERYQQHVTMVYELLQKGVMLNGSVWLYEVKNLTHIPRDILMGPPSNGDRLGCFTSAGIRNLRELIDHGRAPPRSRMAGRIIEHELRFDQVDGSVTNVTPMPNDPRIDSVVTAPDLILRTLGSDETYRWRAVTAVLPRVSDAITPPTVACRTGGYELMFSGSRLVPFSPEVLAEKYGCFECYRCRIAQTVCCLEKERLYDSRVESAFETAELARTLFRSTCPLPSASTSGK